MLKYFKKKLKINLISILTISAYFITMVSFKAFGESNGNKKLTVLMYHSILKDTSVNNKYILNLDEFKKDIEAIKDKNLKTVSIKQIKDYVSGKTDDFPDNAVLITFDDGHYNNYLYAYPILKENNMTAVISIIGKLTTDADSEESQSPRYSYLTSSQIKEMTESGVIEIANHSYDMHKITNDRRGSSKSKNETNDMYAERFIADTTLTNKILSERCSIKTNIYTYPFGAISKQTDTLLRKLGYDVTLSCEEGVNNIVQGMNLMRLKRYNRSGNISSDNFFENKLNL